MQEQNFKSEFINTLDILDQEKIEAKLTTSQLYSILETCVTYLDDDQLKEIQFLIYLLKN